MMTVHVVVGLKVLPTPESSDTPVQVHEAIKACEIAIGASLKQAEGMGFNHPLGDSISIEVKSVAVDSWILE